MKHLAKPRSKKLDIPEDYKIRIVLATLLKTDHALNPWEAKFARNLTTYSKHFKLTTKQRNKARRILDEHTGG